MTIFTVDPGHNNRVGFTRLAKSLLNCGMDRTSLASHVKASSHLNSLSTQSQRRNKTARIADTSSGHNRHGHSIHNGGHQRQRMHGLVTDMSPGFVSFSDDEVHPGALSFHGMIDSGNHVPVQEPGLFERTDKRCRVSG